MCEKTEFITCLLIYSGNIMITVYLLEVVHITGLEQHKGS